MASSCPIIRADKTPWPGSLGSSFHLWELQVQTEGTREQKGALSLIHLGNRSPCGTRLDLTKRAINVCEESFLSLFQPAVVTWLTVVYVL